MPQRDVILVTVISLFHYLLVLRSFKGISRTGRLSLSHLSARSILFLCVVDNDDLVAICSEPKEAHADRPFKSS